MRKSVLIVGGGLVLAMFAISRKYAPAPPDPGDPKLDDDDQALVVSAATDLWNVGFPSVIGPNARSVATLESSLATADIAEQLVENYWGPRSRALKTGVVAGHCIDRFFNRNPDKFPFPNTDASNASACVKPILGWETMPMDEMMRAIDQVATLYP